MEQVRLKTQLSRRFNGTVTFPKPAGNVSFDEKGISQELSMDTAQFLLDYDSTLEAYVEDPGDPEPASRSGDPEKEIIAPKSEIEAMTISQIQEVLEARGVKKSDMPSKKEALVDFAFEELNK